MMDAQRQVLIDALFMAMKLDVRLVPEFCIRVSDGYYHPDPQDARCHPLETVLIGEPVRDEPTDQIAEILGQERDWMAGFADRYQGLPARNADPGSGGDYLQGYQEAADERIARLLRPR